MYDNASSDFQPAPSSNLAIEHKKDIQENGTMNIDNTINSLEHDVTSIDSFEKSSFFEENCVVFSYIAIAMLAATLLPFSYWISLKIYNHFF